MRAKWAQLWGAMPSCERTDEGLKLEGKKKAIQGHLLPFVSKNKLQISPQQQRPTMKQIRGPAGLSVLSSIVLGCCHLTVRLDKNYYFFPF